MNTDFDPLKIAEQRPDRQHLFRGLSIPHRIFKLCEIGQVAQLRPNQDDYWQSLKVRLGRLQSLTKRTIDDLDEKDVHTLQANLCELETMVHEMFFSARLPYMSNMGEWTDSSLTKFCSSDYDLEATVRHYEDLGLEVTHMEDEDTGYHVVISSKDQTIDDVHYPSGITLPSVFHRAVSFHPEFR